METQRALELGCQFWQPETEPLTIRASLHACLPRLVGCPWFSTQDIALIGIVDCAWAARLR
jgi:hypothetical protein